MPAALQRSAQLSPCEGDRHVSTVEIHVEGEQAAAMGEVSHHALRVKLACSVCLASFEILIKWSSRRGLCVVSTVSCYN